jgi:hypothetical protein
MHIRQQRGLVGVSSWQIRARLRSVTVVRTMYRPLTAPFLLSLEFRDASPPGISPAAAAAEQPALGETGGRWRT